MAFDCFVGRDDELAALMDCFERTAEGCSVLVAVGGEAGVGKSRLIREFCARVANRAQKIAVGCCLETIKMPFLPFVQVFRELALDPGFDLDRLEDPVARGRAQTERHTARLQQMAQALLNATSHKPHVVVIEDLHWADAATLGLLEHLAHSSKPGRLLVIVTIRAEAAERGGAFSRVLSRLRGASLIWVRLFPLKASQVTTLLRTAAPKLSRATVERIKELSEGNPLFAEELLRAALDGHGALSDPAYSSIRAMVIDRLYQLTEVEQRIVACAAVVGRFFDVRFVAALAKRSFDETVAALRRARNLQLVREVRDDASETLAFRHAIFAEVVYRELLVVEARDLHARVAEHLERQPDAKHRIAEIAHHYSAAQNTKKALLYNTRAGDDAMRVTAFEDAARFYEEALRYAGSDSPVFAQLAEKRAYTWYAAGLAENTGELFSEALAAYEALGRKHKVVEMLLFLSRQAWNDAETADGYRHAMRAVELIGEDDPGLRDYATTMAASYAAHLGHADEADRILADLALEERPDIAARVADTKAIVAARRGRFEEALRLCRDAQEIAHQSGDPDAVVRVFSNAADIAASCGRRREAAGLWCVAYDAAKAAGYVGRMAYAALGYAAALLDGGEIERAWQLYDAAVETGVTNASVAIQAAGVAALLHAFVDAPPPSFADQDAALELALRSRESLRIGQLGAAIAFACVAEGRGERARAILRRTIDALEFPAFAELLLFLGTVHGDPETQKRARMLLWTLSEGDPTFGTLCRVAIDALDSPPTKRAAALHAALRMSEEEGCVPLRLALLSCAGDGAQAIELAASIDAIAYAERIRSIRSKQRNRMALTRRELEVARLLVDKVSNRGIADLLGISERTVEHHVESILLRLGIRSRWLVTPDLIVRYSS